MVFSVTSYLDLHNPYGLLLRKSSPSEDVYIYNILTTNSSITLFRFITMLWGTNIVLWNVLHIQYGCGGIYHKILSVPQNIVMDGIMLWPLFINNEIYSRQFCA